MFWKRNSTYETIVSTEGLRKEIDKDGMGQEDEDNWHVLRSLVREHMSLLILWKYRSLW
jgi:hypothetical protein